MEIGTPEKICREASKQHDDQLRQSRPDLVGTREQRGLPDRLARREGEGEAGAHDPGECRDSHSFGKIELLDALLLRGLVHLPLLVEPRHRRKPDADQTCQHSHQRDLTGKGRGDLHDRLIDRYRWKEHLGDRGQQRPERGAVTEGDTHAEGHSEIAHGQAESESP